jgi:hypothetical protein
VQKLPEAEERTIQKGLETIVLSSNTWLEIVLIPINQSGKPYNP